MDFFEAQAQAHRTTLRLIALFGAAVLSLVGITVLLVAFVVAWSQSGGAMPTPASVLDAFGPGAALTVAAAGIVALVVVASLFRLISLSGGGRSVAEALGGVPVAPNTDDASERRLLNVVEEMAIAAGLPVPPVYVIEEAGINAFAAGYGPDDAVVGITRGALNLLDRDELQGVVGHEFSHVLNGDMRLNIRLMAILFGILVIGIVGRVLIPRGRSGRRSSNGKGGNQIVVLALGLMVIGYAGTFFGGLIKAAVSRQREFLADASAVQFTRDPRGIRDALRKIGGHGSRLEHARAEEMSHMFFGEAVRGFLGALTATHPPLEDRIRAIDPDWDGALGEFGTVQNPIDTGHVDAPRSAPGAGLAASLAAGAAFASAGPALTAAAARDAIGTVAPGDVARARSLIDGLPAAWHDAAHEPFGARALVYALLVPEAEPDPAAALIAERAETGVPELLHALLRTRGDLAPGARLTAVHLAMPALKTLSETQYRRFMDTLVALIRLDARISRFEWILHQVVRKELQPHFDGVRRVRRGLRIDDAPDACATVLGILASIDQDTQAAVAEAVQTGLEALGIERSGKLDVEQLGLDSEDPDQQRLTEALRTLRRLHPLQRPRLLKAAVATVQHDGVVSVREHELLQGIAAALDCPMPTLGDR